MAREPYLKPADINLLLVRSGADLVGWDTQAYHLSLVTKENQEIILLAMGVNKISSQVEVYTKAALKTFPQVQEQELYRSPSGGRSS